MVLVDVFGWFVVFGMLELDMVVYFECGGCGVL